MTEASVATFLIVMMLVLPFLCFISLCFFAIVADHKVKMRRLELELEIEKEKRENG